MAERVGLQLSFRVERPHGCKLEMAACTADDAMYALIYRYEQRGREWWAVLESVRETMPPITPQANVLVSGDAARLPMMDEYGYSATLEAEQRRKEWAELARNG